MGSIVRATQTVDKKTQQIHKPPTDHETRVFISRAAAAADLVIISFLCPRRAETHFQPAAHLTIRVPYTDVAHRCVYAFRVHCAWPICS